MPGFCARTAASSRPRRASTPGRNPSTSTSACAASSSALARSSVVLEVQLDAALALVDGGEEAGVVAHRVAARRLDLQHVGAQGHQQRRGVGAGPPDAQVEDPEPGEERRRARPWVESLASGRVASQRAGILLVHRSDRSVRPRGLQRLAPARPPPRAVHHRWHYVRAALGAFPPLPGRRSGHGQPARPVPLHDAVLPPRRERDPRVLRPGQAAARRGPVLRGAACPPVGAVHGGRALGRSAGGGLARGGALPPGAGGPCRGGPGGGRRASWWGTPAWPAPGSSPTPSTTGPSRSPSSTATCGRPRPPSGPAGAASPEWAGPLERVDAFRWDWFATLTPQ